MKIILVSDSHGNKEGINFLINTLKYDYFFFAGDGLRDLGSSIYDNRTVCVKGNCDFFAYGEPITQTLFVEGVKILLTHGDYYRVKYGMDGLKLFAEGKEYKLVCFGHTHNKTHFQENGITYVNAGAFKSGNYAEIDVKGGNINVEFKNINDIEII